MKTALNFNNDLYYTTDHEWIDFRETIAFTGVCNFKLCGFKNIAQVLFNEPLGFKKRGDILATISSTDFEITAHMPVDGNVMAFNPNLIFGDDSQLLKHADYAWIAQIVPSISVDRKDLILPDNYRKSALAHFVKK